MKEVSKEDLLRLWYELGIKTGDVVMCHSFIGKLGKIVSGVETIIETLQQVVGSDGTLVFPSYTYSYFESKVFDVEQSMSTVGILGDVSRKSVNSIRSLDPCFSMVAIGKKSKTLMERIHKNSFGEDSIYNKLLNENFKALLLGVDFTALSLFMHLEKLLNVPYRYDKEFTGETVVNGEKFNDKIIHFVRDHEFGFETNRKKIGKVLLEDEQCFHAHLGYSEHHCIESQRVWDIVAKEYAANPYCLINKL